MKVFKKRFVALLPMKKNSERIPEKNIKILGKKILFYHILDSMKKTQLISKVVINTDSEKIAKFAKSRYGNWIFINERLPSLIGDAVPMNKVIGQDMKLFDDDQLFFQTHSTNPFLSVSTIRSSILSFNKKIINGKNDSLFSVSLIKSRLYDEKLKAINHNPKFLKRTQDLKNIYEENSNFYIFSKKSFIKNKSKRIGKKPSIYIMKNRLESLDIDNPDDWSFAQKIIKMKSIK